MDMITAELVDFSGRTLATFGFAPTVLPPRIISWRHRLFRRVDDTWTYRESNMWVLMDADIKLKV